METAICTRCQSSNPLYTKYCLTCGLEITQKMRISIATAKAAPVVEPEVAEEPQAPILKTQEPVTDDDQSQSQKESSIWSRIFGK